MLHWVVVDVVDMMFQVIIIYDQMFPVATLPKTTLAFDNTGSMPPFT